MSATFASLSIQPELADQLKKNGLITPTPVQRQAIPLLLAGKDAILQAQTGTGKTLAFALPILEVVNANKDHVQALIITPTRELALQITNEIRKYIEVTGAKVLAAYGGQDVEAQIKKLKGAAHIVVGTPGRLLDHLQRETLDLGRLQMLVLDEADQMLAMGFLNEVEEILRYIPKSRQTVLCSATMPGPVRNLALNYMRTPEDVRIEGRKVTLDEIEQLVIMTTDRAKQASLLQLLEQHRPYLAVVFCRTKIRAKKLNEALQAAGLDADELHGDMTQAKREQVMKRFRDAKLQILVATDVAARGLDVEGVTHVYNYDIPHDAETYIHRIGRTGRAGGTGMAVTLAAPRDSHYLQLIERSTQQKLEVRTMQGGASAEREFGETARGGERSNPRAERNTKREFSRGGASNGRGGSAAGGRGGRRDDRNAGAGRAGRGEDRNAGAGRAGRGDDRNAGAGRAGRGDDRNAGAGRAGRGDDRNAGAGRAGRGDDRNAGAGRAGRGDDRNAGAGRAGRGDDRNAGASRAVRGDDRNAGRGRTGRGDDRNAGPRGKAGGGARSSKPGSQRGGGLEVRGRNGRG